MNDERRGALVLGAILILVGAVFFVINVTGIDVETWPLFIVLPGVVLFGASFAVGGESGSGLAVAGSIVTTVGLVLAVQEAADLYETWAYAWALVAPASVGFGLAVYGALTRQPRLVEAGLPTLGIGLALFFGFGLFFEGVVGLSGDRVPILRDLLPVGLVLLGAAMIAASLLGRRRET